MRLRTFIGKSMPEVIAQIRRELGSDAVIVSSIQEKTGVRVTAAIEQTPVVAAVKHESVKHSLSTLDGFVNLLERQRLPREISDNILMRIGKLDQEIVNHGSAAILENLFTFSPLPHSWASKGGVLLPFMLIGPTGAGKSLATAKLAFEYLLAGWRVAIITTDGEKAGAHAQLTRFTEAMKIPLAFAKDAESLDTCLRTEFANHLVFVDTTGLNPLNKDNIGCLKELACAFRHAPTLVVPAGLDAFEALDFCHSIKDLGAKRFIHTKVDSSHRFSALLSVMIESGLQLSSLGNGAELGNRLIPASANAVAELLGQFAQENTAANTQNIHSQTIAKAQEAHS